MFPQEGTVNLEIWNKVGRAIKWYHVQARPQKVPVDWTLIREGLYPHQQTKRIYDMPEGIAESQSKDTTEPSDLVFSSQREFTLSKIHWQPLLKLSLKLQKLMP